MNSESALIVLPVFLIIGLGFCLKRTGLLDGDFLVRLNRLVYYIGLPALLFYKIGTADFHVSFNGNLLVGLVTTTMLIFGLSYVYGLIRGFSPDVQGAFCQGALRGNLAYVGLAIVDSAYGEEGFAIAGILLGFLVPLLNVLSVVALMLPQRKNSLHATPLFFIKEVIYNPLFIAAFCGILWSFSGLALSPIIDRGLKILTGMSLPLALLAIGGSFSIKKMKGDLIVGGEAVCIKLIIMPILSAVVLFLLGVTGLDFAVGVLLAGTPTATATYIMAQQHNSDVELAGTIIMFSTLLSLASYSICLYFLSSSLS